LPIAVEYTYVRCDLAAEAFDEVLWSYAAADARTELRVGDLFSARRGRFSYDGGAERFPQREVVSIPDLDGSGGLARPGTRRPLLHENQLNGQPIIEFYELTLPQGRLTAELAFDGSALVARSYTIFVVAAQPGRVSLTYTTPSGDQSTFGDNLVDYFLHGDDDGQLRNLVLGWEESGVMTYKHDPYGLEWDMLDTQTFRVFAFRFGVDVGMAAYVDGVLVDEDPGDTRALQAFPGATLDARARFDGSPVLAVFWLAEIIAYQGAGTEQQILDETARLQQKYGLGR
jgi:hypothetical protein